MPALHSLRQMMAEVTGRVDALRLLEQAVHRHLPERAFDPGDDFNYYRSNDPATSIFAHYEIDRANVPRLTVYDPDAGDKMVFDYAIAHFPDVATSVQLNRMTPDDETCLLTFQYAHASLVSVPHKSGRTHYFPDFLVNHLN